MNNLDYGIIGNCRSAALVSSTGSIDWCCLPDFDSPSLFAKILDTDKGGHFSFLVDEEYQIRQGYFYRTNILCTEFTSHRGSFEVIDFMPRYKTSDNDYFMPPEIYRYIRLKSGNPSFRISYNPKLNYARDTVGHRVKSNHVRSYSKANPSDCVFLYSSLNLKDILDSNVIVLTKSQFVLLSYNEKLIEVDINRVYLEFQRTKVYWLNWANRSKKFSLFSDQIDRSLLVLKLLSYHSTGAVLAAVTTSIPESIGDIRNWDYRFCWLRDASMSIETLLLTGHDIAARRFIYFIKGIIKSKQDVFQIVYGIRGERTLTESELPHLAGFRNSRPVRIGNTAFIQNQHDVFGYLLNVVYNYFKFFPGTLDEIEDIWEVVKAIVRTVEGNWSLPDHGIWEIRSEKKHFVLSKVMSWVTMDRAANIASLLGKRDYRERWSGVAAEIRKDVMLNGWNEELQSFTQAYGSKTIDASSLLLAEYGFIRNDHDKFRNTVSAVKAALFRDGLMYRYVDPDDFGRPASSFTICTFWLIQALYRIGETREAQSIFETLLSYGNHVGLFSEDIDFKTKELLGNFPQAYSHLALINTAILFSEEQPRSKFIKP